MEETTGPTTGKRASVRGQRICIAILIAIIAGAALAVPHIVPKGAESISYPIPTAESGQTTQPVPVPSPPPETVHFETDPDNALPVYTIGSFDALFWSRHGIDTLEKLEGTKMRIKATVDIIGDNDLTFLYTPHVYITDFVQIEGFGDAELNNLKKGDSVDIVCVYTGDFKKPSDVGPTKSDFWFLFHGLELHKVE